MKPTPLSALLADDLLLDRVGARLDTDDDLGSLLLAVAHQVDAPIPRAAPTRRRRSHRGLTVLTALGVAVSGATVAAAVELAPGAPDQLSGAPHLRGGVPRSLQELLPFLTGTPFQGRLSLRFGDTHTGQVTGSLTAALLPADGSSVYPMGDPIVGATTSPEDLQDPAREKTQSKGTPNDETTLTDQSESARDASSQGDQSSQANQANPASQVNQGNQGDQGGDSTEPVPQPKATKTPAPTTTTPTPSSNGVTGVANGQDNGHNGHGDGRGSSGGTETTGTGTTGTTPVTGATATMSGDTAGDAAETDDPASRVPPKGKNKVKVVPQPPVSGAAPAGTAGSTGTGTTTATTATTPVAP